jgi:hypothetical protein
MALAQVGHSSAIQLLSVVPPGAVIHFRLICGGGFLDKKIKALASVSLRARYCM